jgi:hypothetical protein
MSFSVPADAEVVHQDILTCGVCQKPFALADIVKFIQHKVLACNKENYSLSFSGGDHRDANNTDSDDADGGGGGGASGSSSLPVPLSVVNTRRPSISAPINSKKASAASSSASASVATPGRILCTPPPPSPRMLGSADILMDEAPSSTPKRRAGSSSPAGKTDELNHHSQDEDLKPRIKQEHVDTGSSPDEAIVKRIRTDVVDAESNTTHSGKCVSEEFHRQTSLSYCHVCGVNTDGLWTSTDDYYTRSSFSDTVFTSLLVTVSNGGHSSSSAFPNCPNASATAIFYRLPNQLFSNRLNS